MIAEYFNYDQFGELVLGLPLAGETRPFTPTAVEEPGAAANARMAANSLRRITLDDALGGRIRRCFDTRTATRSRSRTASGAENRPEHRRRARVRLQPLPDPADSACRLHGREPAADCTRARRRNAPRGRDEHAQLLHRGRLPAGDPLDNKCAPANSVECRGHDADQPDEFKRQRDKLVAAVVGANADVLGLNEIENTTGVDALTDPQGIVPGLNDASARATTLRSTPA